ncbi:MAG: hypothetical protein Q4E34_01100 [Synergistaceae bacterium]|nr:hypothetical protein [Synergistaceae bacterium]
MTHTPPRIIAYFSKMVKRFFTREVVSDVSSLALLLTYGWLNDFNLTYGWLYWLAIALSVVSLLLLLAGCDNEKIRTRQTD